MFRSLLFLFTLSVCLFQLLRAETHIFIKAEGFYAFGSAQNATFWKKLLFGPSRKMRLEHANIMDYKRSINQNVHVCLNNTVGLDGQLRKYPDKNSSVLPPEADSHASHLISLLSLCTKLTLTPPISSLCSTFFVVSLSALSSVESSSSSSSFFRLLQRTLILFFFFFILFLSNLIWEIHFEGRDLINKTPSNTDPLTSLPSKKEKSETWMWVWPKTQTQMLLCPAMGLSPTILRQQHHQEPTKEVLRKKKKKKETKKESYEYSGVWRNGREKKGGKKNKKEKRTCMCVEEKKRGGKKGKKEKRRMKYYHNFFIIFSQ